MTNTELAKKHGAKTYTNRHGKDDPYIAMSVKQLDAYTQAAIAADQGPDLTSAYMAGVERGKDMAAAQAVQAVPLTDTQIEAIGHRKAWRYKKSSDPHHSDTFTFNRHTLIEFARAVHAVPYPSYVAPQPPAEQSQSRLTDEQVYWIAQNYGIGVHTCDVLGFYADLMSTTGIVEPARGDVPATGQIKTGFCKQKAQPGGCPMHNTECGWPMCDQPPRGE